VVYQKLAFTAVFLYKIIRNHLNVGYVAIVGALLYVTNPNILYMAVTPMTETSFMLLFVGAAYFYMRWMSGPKKYLSLNSTKDGGQKSHVIFNLVMCSIFISLATLCRYEGWVLPLFFVSYIANTTTRAAILS
jgi:Gpi18-like mannosyltransferase